ncbi:MAG: DNA polymerase III subunit delta [Clostridia bacterium]|nr:DNA polymerase III subunit delta [Clostridia bacterium]
MKYVIFSKELKESNLSPCYLLQGEDFYFKNSAISKIISASSLQEKEINLSKYTAENVRDFIQSLDFFPMLSNYRISILETDKITDELKVALEKYALNPNLSTIAIVNYSGAKKAQLKGFVEVDCGKESQDVVKKWIAVSLKRNGIQIADLQATEIVNRLDCNMGKVANVVDVLSAYKNYQGQITSQDIEMLVPDEIEGEVFDLVNAIIAKDINRIFPVLEKIKMQKLEATPFISMLYNNYRRMFFAATSEKDVAELAEGLKVKEFAVKKAKELSKKYSKIKIKRSIDYLRNLESGIKTGKIASQSMLDDIVLHLINV